MSAAALRRVYARSDRVVGRRIGEEYVLVPLVGRGADLDSLLNLNQVAAFIWERLDGTRSGEEVVEAVVEHFDVEREQARRDYLHFVAQMQELKALVPAAPKDA